MSFEARVNDRIHLSGSNLCIGLDPRPELIEGPVGEFLKQVVGETAEFAAAYKPNIAYFEAMGTKGYGLLESFLDLVPEEIPVILDAKRSDIAETMKYYAKAYFEEWDVDAVTLNASLGFDSIEPFLSYPEKGVYLLGITSNKGAKEFLLQEIAGMYMFEHIQAMRDRAGASPTTVGLVVGLTSISDAILARVQDLPLLVPGFGAQGGDLGRLNPAGRTAPILVNASRSVLFGREDTFDEGIAGRARAAMETIRAALGAAHENPS